MISKFQITWLSDGEFMAVSDRCGRVVLIQVASQRVLITKSVLYSFLNDRIQRPIFWESQFYYKVKKVKEG